MHIELITATATQPNTGAAAAAVTGDSLTVKNAMLAMWTTLQATAGFAQVLYPSAHDTTRGFRVGNPATDTQLGLPLGFTLNPKPQELMAVTLAGSNTAGDVEQWSSLMYYEDLPGVNQRLKSAAEVESGMKRMTTIEASIVSSAGPGYSGTELITADSDLLRANTDYALLGITSRTRVHNAWIIGPDTGNIRLGAPCMMRYEVASQFFMLMSRVNGCRCVPVINSGNKASTSIGVHTDENAGTFVVTYHLAEL
jgi:hypothetical protein